jgi:hypothetical protein
MRASEDDAPQQQQPYRAVWMKDARWGVMNHYLADWIARRENFNGGKMTVARWNDLINHFDVEGLAQQVASVGAGYYLLTIGQNSGFYLSPNAVYDRLTGIQPSKCSRRDLVAEMAAALQKRGIRMMVYLPSGAPAGDHDAVKALQWHNGPYRNREFQRMWEQIIREWSERWGRKISGWWFDGCYWPNAMYRPPDPPDFATFTAAARAGNPDSAIAFNPGVIPRLISLTPHEDYTAGEMNEPDRASIRRVVDGRVDGAHPHVLSFLGDKWGLGAPRFSTEQAVLYSRKIADDGAAITWDVPLQNEGLISRPFLDQLSAIGKALADGKLNVGR